MVGFDQKTKRVLEALLTTQERFVGYDIDRRVWKGVNLNSAYFTVNDLTPGAWTEGLADLEAEGFYRPVSLDYGEVLISDEPVFSCNLCDDPECDGDHPG